MQTRIWIAALAAMAGLAACGNTDTERGLTGAALGGGAALATDSDPLLGAAAGGAAGVLADDVGLVD